MIAVLEVREEPDGSDRDAILQALVDYNRAAGPPTEALPLAILIRDGEGRAVGGLWGKSLYDWLFVELLAVPEGMRGQGLGTQLIDRAEQVARRRGCVGIWLDTFSFQARGFYERLGFELSGTIEDHPVGGARYFLSKRLG